MVNIPTFIMFSMIVIFGFTPAYIRFFFAVTLSVPQLYLFNVNGVDFSLALFFGLSLWPEFIKNIKVLICGRIFISIVLFLLFTFFSFLWSSDLSSGMKDVVYLIVFLFVISASYDISRSNLDLFYKISKFVVVLIFFQAILIIVFRLSPELESGFIFSNISPLFIGNGLAEALMGGDVKNNFFDPEKSGGLFTNGNVGAAYVGISIALSWLLYTREKSFLLFFIIIIQVLSVFFSGSKACAIFMVVLPVFLLLIYNTTRSRKRFQIFFALALVISAFSLLFFTNYNLHEQSEFVEQSTETTKIRILIWEYAVDAFFENPIFGQGFGGWQHGFINYASYYDIPEFPPHNTLIYVWSKSGIFALTAVILFMCWTIRFSYSLIRDSDNEVNNVGTCLLYVSLWLFIHGLGENFGAIGESHQLVIFAILLGFAFSYRFNFFDENKFVDKT